MSIKAKFLVALLVLLGAIAYVWLRDTHGTFTGILDYGFEANAFSPDGITEVWSFQFEGDVPEAFLSDYRKWLDERGEKYAIPLPYRITAKGSVSHLGKYGHMGLCARRFSVEEFLSFERIPAKKEKEPNHTARTTCRG